MLLGYLEGFAGFADAMKAASDSPEGAMKLVFAPMRPSGTLMKNMVGVTMVGMMRDVNKTVLDAVDLRDVHGTLTCVHDVSARPPLARVPCPVRRSDRGAPCATDGQDRGRRLRPARPRAEHQGCY